MEPAKNQASKPAAQTPQTTGRLKLKTWRGTVPISDASAQFTVVLGGMVNLGGDGTCEVTNLELEPSTGIVYYTLQSTNVAGRVRHMFLQGEGGGEFA